MELMKSLCAILVQMAVGSAITYLIVVYVLGLYPPVHLMGLFR